jgi:hypothetical protein
LAEDAAEDVVAAEAGRVPEHRLELARADLLLGSIE